MPRALSRREGKSTVSCWFRMGMVVVALACPRLSAAQEQPSAPDSPALISPQDAPAAPAGPAASQAQTSQTADKAPPPQKPPIVRAGRDGFSLRSADDAFQLRLRGYAQSDSRVYLEV